MHFSIPLQTFVLISQFWFQGAHSAALAQKFPSSNLDYSEAPSEDYDFLILPRSDLETAEEAEDELNDYIVIFDEKAAPQKREVHNQWVNDLLQKRSSNGENEIRGIKGYFNDNEKRDSSNSIFGYHGSFSKDEIEQIKGFDSIALVERETYDQIQQDFVYVQYDSPWGLGRISHKTFSAPSGEGSADYVFGNQGGTKTTIYVLDSGVRSDHVEFTGRVRWGPNYVDNLQNDVHGHGTHITGIAAGRSVGVAKFANIVVVKVIDSERRASISNIIKAVQWVIDDHNSNPGQKSIINYSAVGVISDARNSALQKAVDAGIIVATAAGNNNEDACSYGPANMASSSSGVITVAALNYTNSPADFSNYGNCVSVYAPGVSIYSAANDSTTAYKYMSGTSMSSPFAAGLSAYFWSLNPSLSVGDVKAMVSDYNQGAIVGLSSGPNKIAYNHL